MKHNGPLVHDQYSRWFYESGGPLENHWQGIPTVKHPIDMWCYAEIIHETKPELIIETGSFMGGSALYLANVCDAQDRGRVVSVELVTNNPLPDHPRLEFLLGMSSTSKEVIEQIGKRASGKRSMVILDSAHNRKHVLQEMKLYQRFVSKGCYMIVEDTNIHGYPYGHGDIDEDGGPMEAVRDFQPKNQGFQVDRHPERMGMSQNPGGFLQRIR